MPTNRPQQRQLPRLKDLGALMRLGVTLLVVTLLGGYAVSGVHLKWHHEDRDEREGLTLDDIRGAYHGITSRAPLLEALERGHPDELTDDPMPDADRRTLIEWVESGNINEDFDNYAKFEDYPPADILFDNCVSCHARDATGPDAAPAVPLKYLDDVQGFAVSREVKPNSKEIIATSLHTHAPTMAVVLLVVAALGAMTRWWGWLTGGLVAVGGLGLLLDSAGQWLARGNEFWVYGIVGGGFAYAASTGMLGLLVVVDLWLPGGRGTRAGGTPGPEGGESDS